MNKFIFNDYFLEPQGKIAKRMLFKSGLSLSLNGKA